MEKVLDVYKRPCDPQNPVVCMDESPKQLIAETRIPIPASPGKPEKYDSEYERRGMCSVFIAFEQLAGNRMVEVTEKITIVMDNLNTHEAGSFYEAFPPDKAKALWDRFNFVYTPKLGSWLNIAEIELNVLTGQCLKRRMDTIEFVRKEVLAWENNRNNKNAKVNWQFTTDNARIKPSRLHPTMES